MSIVEEFRAAGISAALICDETPDDERVFIRKQLESRRCQVVANCDVLCEGVDWPFVSCIGLVRPTKRLRRYLQAAGRGMRASPGKSDMILIDHAGCVLYHGFPDEDRIWPLSAEDNVDSTKQKSPGESKPIRCKQCHFIFKGTRVCPQCGAMNGAPPRKANNAAGGNGTLVEARRDDLPDDARVTLEQRFWCVCIGAAIKRDKHAGMAAAMFSGKFGRPPWEACVSPLADDWKLPAAEVFPGFARRKA